MEQYLRRQYIHEGTDEFNAYINGPTTLFSSSDPDSVISWIISKDNRWPGIKQHALDLLSIPAMSAELERVFSQAKLTVTPTRNRLSEHTIEVLELLRHWWVNNIISQERGGGGRQYRKRRLINDGSEAFSTMQGDGDIDMPL